jgi:rSAM/selenodomain-associated transferase 1
MSLLADTLKHHYTYPQYRLLVFAKSPVLGAAKTRLQPLLPKEFSLALHCQLLKTVLKQWSESAICPIDCWIAGDEDTFVEKIINDDALNLPTLPIYQQKGQDLGERLAHGIEATFSDVNHNKTTSNIDKKKYENVKGVFVVGTDCPSLDAQYLQTACLRLQQYDAVIGPADDGGYVLLGIKIPNAKLFKDIDWGGSSVFEQTLSRLREFNLSYFVLPPLPDIDHPQDLSTLRDHEAFSHLLVQADKLIGHHTDK